MHWAARAGGMLEKRTGAGLTYERFELPWWSGMVLGAVLYIALRWVVPSVGELSPAIATAASAARSSAAFIALLCVAHSVISLLLAYRKRRHLDLEISLAALRALPRERFEHFAAEAFRSEGYAVAESASRDCGADLEITQGDERLVVQCRRWRSDITDAAPLREVCACMESTGASGCVFVTTGIYGDEALAFAAGKPLRLVAGRELERMLRAGGARGGRMEGSPRPFLAFLTRKI